MRHPFTKLLPIANIISSTVYMQGAGTSIQNQIPRKKKKNWDDKKCNLSKKNSRIRYEVGIPEMLEDEEHLEGNIEAFVVGRDNYAVLVPLSAWFYFLIRVLSDFESSDNRLPWRTPRL
jgi:hypothetical protein